jgi:hypothetical protein
MLLETYTDQWRHYWVSGRDSIVEGTCSRHIVAAPDKGEIFLSPALQTPALCNQQAINHKMLITHCVQAHNNISRTIGIDM